MTLDDAAVERLVGDAQAGDPRAFGRLFDHYHASVYRYIVSRVHRPTDAEDLTQLVFVKALEALTDEQREAVALRFFAGLSAREAAAVMGKQEGTVRGLQFRAIAAMRRSLGIEDPDMTVVERPFRTAGDEPIGPSGIG